ncbi:MAG: CRISPR-associated protein Cas4 [Fervidicoccaceae archaeon]
MSSLDRSRLSILDLLYERKRAEFAERLSELRDESVIYVVELAGCPKKREFRVRFPELTFRFDPQLILGDVAHAGLEHLLSSVGFEVEKEVSERVEVDGRVYVVKGRVDAMSEDRIVEIKTGRPGQRLPQEHHVLQLKIYMALTGSRRGTLIYVTGDRLVEFEVEAESRLALGELVLEHLRADKVPKWDWECRYCAFSRLCPRRLPE